MFLYYTLKKYLLLLILILVGISLSAQDNKKVRRVYYLDATYSMINPEQLWDPVRKDLEQAINAIQDQTTEIYVIAFGADKGEKLHVWSDVATSTGKKNIISGFMSYQPQKNTMTYLDRPLQDFYSNHIPSQRTTYCFLMTDGKDENVNTSIFPNLLAQWEYYSQNKDVYGFYVALNDAAADKSVRNIILTQDKLWLVKSANVNINTIRLDNNAISNIRQDNRIEIPIRDGSLAGLNVVADADPIDGVEIGKCSITDGKLCIDFNVTGDMSTMPDKQSINIGLSLSNASEFDILLTDKVSATFNNKKEKVMKTPVGQIKMGEVMHYDEFWWKPRFVQPLQYKLAFEMSPDAKANPKSYAELEFVYNDGEPIDLEKMVVVINEDTLKNNKFKVSPDCLVADIAISFVSDAETGKHQGYIKLGNNNLDRVNNTELSDKDKLEVCQWTIRNNKKTNPLKVAVLSIAAFIIALVLLWFIIFRKIFYPKFGSIQKTFIIPNATPLIVKFKGARQVVISAKHNKRQSLWNRFWTGKIIYKTHPAFNTPISFKPMRERQILTNTLNDYIVSPNPMPGIGSATIINKANNQKIIVN